MSKSIRVTVQYPNRPGARFDWGYYLEKHVPMVAGRFGSRLLGAEVFRGLAGAGGSPTPTLCTTHLSFASLGDFEAAFAPHADHIMGDTPNYTDVAPAITIEERA